MAETLLEVKGLVKHFPLTRGVVFKRHIGDVRAVDGVDIDLQAGETHGLVGESGCGKSTLGKVILRLHEPTSGEAFFKGRDLFQFSKKEMREARRDLQIIFQDPFASLNPRMTVRAIVSEAWVVHGMYDDRERRERAEALLERVSNTAKAMGDTPRWRGSKAKWMLRHGQPMLRNSAPRRIWSYWIESRAAAPKSDNRATNSASLIRIRRGELAVLAFGSPLWAEGTKTNSVRIAIA